MHLLVLVRLANVYHSFTGRQPAVGLVDRYLGYVSLHAVTIAVVGRSFCTVWPMHAYADRYLALLGEQDPIEVLQLSPLRVEELVQRMTPADYGRSYQSGKWSVREILAHLADVELSHAVRFRQTLAESEPVLQPFDQDRWARRYRRADPSLAVATLRAVRSWNLALLATLDLDGWLKEAYHAEHGMLSLDLMVRVLAGHDLNHLVQIERVAGER